MEVELPAGSRLSFEDEPATADVEVLPDALEAFNEARWPGHLPWQNFAVFVRAEDHSIRAGLAGDTYAGWMFIRYLWVAEALRGRGVGRLLVARAEERAMARDCHSAWVDTFSFQARGFYEKLGYVVFGALDYPPEHRRFFLEKRLSPGKLPSIRVSSDKQ